jgi:hypothetical protein
MANARFGRRRRPGLPGGVALLLGLGAISAASARAEAPPPGPGASNLQLFAEGGRIWLSEAGGEFRELQLGDTAEARHLKRLIEERGSAPVRLAPTVLAGGGGMGFHWWGPAKPESPDKAGAPGKPGKANKTGQPPKKDPAEAAKKG